ncbi:MAG: double-strand break repair protein AddB, partial [Bdellovibrionales bacterium]
KERRIMACELMRPAETSKEWQNLKDNAFKKAIENLKILECETSQNEAQIIATYMRQTLEEPTKTAALITPDRNLAKRVATACKKWNIEIDDSAGTPLSQTPIGQFLLLSITTIDEHLSPVSLLSLLKHPLTHHDFQNNLNHLEINILRGFKPTKGIQGLKNKLAKQSLDSSENDILQKQINALESAFEPCLNLIENDEKTEFKIILTKHIQLCETLHNHDQLWSNEDGNKASTILAKLLEQSHTFPPIQPKEYSKILQQFLDEATIRPAYGTHPRLQILGQLEARLIDADLVILGGLNEGTWPPEPSHDPWMSRPMRKNFGLPTSERSIGLSAHDFVQALCTSNVVITRSKLQDGAPTVPARWLGRLETVLSAAKTPISPLKESMVQNWVDDMHNAHTLKPFTRPAPKPPLKARPQKLSVTKIETWLKNPYAIYAHSILNLKTLDPLEKAADAALKGQMLHNALDHFITHNKDEIPKNAAKQILNNAQEYCANETQDEEEWYFYWPKFETITDQFLIKEHQWRDIAKPFKTEINGQIAIQAKSSQFTLYGRADRIDKKESGVAIIDYKSGGTYPKKSIEHGDNPQLPLEALIAQDGGFENIPPLPCTYLGYWVLNGTTPVELENIDDMLVDTKAALIALIDTFNNPNTPYYAIPRATKIPRFDDYAHLARIKEWAALDDADSEAAA